MTNLYVQVLTPSVEKIPYGECHCGCGKTTPVARISDHRTGQVKGQPTKFFPCHKSIVPISERFWKYVNKSGPVMRPDLTPCWLWIGAHDGCGYGQIISPRMPGTRRFVLLKAHILSLTMHKGCGDDGAMALHRCDNPPCINPDHLYWGDYKQNRRDAVERGRAINDPFVEIRKRLGAEKRAHPICIRGHQFSEENTRIRKNGNRTCRTCEKMNRINRKRPA